MSLIKTSNASNDYLLAIQIQFQLDEEDELNMENEKHGTEDDSNIVSLSRNENLVNPEYDLIDPCPDIHALFQEYDKKYFYSRLGSCIVEWSKRMTICAGIFYLRGGGTIRLSEPLLKYRPRYDLVQTLLHEMIHAYLYLTRNNKDRGEHGDEFKSHMNRINALAGTNITIYHSFHDEVNHQRQHIWRCNGVCQNMKPFYGYVKRSMNRVPGPNDTWWNNHKSMCSGTFVKIAEPEKYKLAKKEKNEKGKRKSDDDLNETKTNKKQLKASKSPIVSNIHKIENYFTTSPDSKLSQPNAATSSSQLTPLKTQAANTLTKRKKSSPIQQTQSNRLENYFSNSKSVTQNIASSDKLEKPSQPNIPSSDKLEKPSQPNIPKTPPSKPHNKSKSPKFNVSPESQPKLTQFFIKTPPKTIESSTIKTNVSVKSEIVEHKSIIDDIVFVDEIKVDNDCLIIDDDKKPDMKKKVECPLCFEKFPEFSIENHVNSHFN